MPTKEQIIASGLAKIEEYREMIESNPSIVHYKIAEIYLKIYDGTKDKVYSDHALAHYTNAIEAEKFSGDGTSKLAVYLAKRSKLLFDRGETELALSDMKEAAKLPRSDDILGLWARSTLDDVLKISSVKDQIKQLKDAGTIDSELANLLSEHANVTSNLVLQVGRHNEILGGHAVRIETLEDMMVQRIEQLQDEIETLKIQTIANTMIISSHDKMLTDSGISQQAEVLARLRGIESSAELYNYYKTFYWTTLDLFEAYRILSTNLVLGNKDHGASTKEKAIKFSIDLATKVASALAKGIPLAGGVIASVDQAIDSIYGAVMGNRLENKTAAINRIIEEKFRTEDEISVVVAKIALDITEAKSSVILSHRTTEHEHQGVLRTMKDWVQNKAKFIKQKILPSIDLHREDSHGVEVALQDVIMLMAYLCKNYTKIISDEHSIDELCKAIVLGGGLEEVLASTTLPVERVEGEVFPASASADAVAYSASQEYYEHREGGGVSESKATELGFLGGVTNAESMCG